MQIVEAKVFRRKTPPGACVEFMGRDGESIEIELRGDGFDTMTDQEIVARARTTMADVGRIHEDNVANEAGLDQTLELP